MVDPMSEPLSNDDQVFRLICCGVSYLGLVMRNGVVNVAGRVDFALMRQSLVMGVALYNEAKTAGVWPIVQPPENP